MSTPGEWGQKIKVYRCVCVGGGVVKFISSKQGSPVVAVFLILFLIFFFFLLQQCSNLGPLLPEKITAPLILL